MRHGELHVDPRAGTDPRAGSDRDAGTDPRAGSDRDAGTIGVPDEEWGEVVKPVIELQPGYEAGEALAAELLEHCRARLARFKCPSSIELEAELPRQDSGKLYRQVLRERYGRSAEAAREQPDAEPTAGKL